MGNGFYPTEIGCKFGQGKWQIGQKFLTVTVTIGVLTMVAATPLAIALPKSGITLQKEARPVAIANDAAGNDQQKNFTCPTNVSQLTALLLKDLPAYSNRVIQRTQSRNQEAEIENYIITASQAEFEPLQLPRLPYNQIDSDQEPTQVFFTVLERQYVQDKIVDIPSYHWLFLTLTTRGWQTVILFSRFGNTTENAPPAPPRETTDGIIGQGIQLWLRDCNAGAVK
ncbi:MAG: hypothetical protein ACRC1Z_01720 [Waterburya sp.]